MGQRRGPAVLLLALGPGAELAVLRPLCLPPARGGVPLLGAGSPSCPCTRSLPWHGTSFGGCASAGHLAGSLASGTACADVYQGFSDCVLKLGANMATYEEVDSIEPQGLHRICGYWDEFHTCALTALWECQKEAAAVWERLRRESRKIKFQGSLFDLCSPSTAQSFAWTHVPGVSILSIPLVITWLNL